MRTKLITQTIIHASIYKTRLDMRAPLQITRIQSQFKLLENTNTQHSWDRGHPPSSRYRFPRTCTCVVCSTCVILHGSRTGTDEYFIVRSRNGVITFLWFLFLPLHVHVSSYTQHAYIYMYCLVLPRSILSLHSQYSRKRHRGPTFVIS